MEGKNHRLLQCALEILNDVSDRQEPVSFKEICETAQMPKSTVHNLVQTLFNMNYLSQDPITGKYTVGMRSFITGNAYRVTNPAQIMAKEIVERVARQSNETTHYAVLEGTDVVYIYKFDSTHSIRVYSQVGKRVPAHVTAIGKAILSGYTDEELRSFYPDPVLPALTPSSITSLDALLVQLRQVRATSVAFENEESSPQVKCIAVSVMNTKGRPVAGLSLAMPVYRGEDDTPALARLLLDAKQELEQLYALYD